MKYSFQKIINLNFLNLKIMKTSSKINTPKENPENEEELLIKKEFKLKYLSEIYEIIIGKSKNNIFIKSSIYELKLNSEDLSILTKYQFNSIDDSFEFIENIFNQKKSYIKNISSDEMKLIIKTIDVIKVKEKEIELYLMKNLDNKNEVIKDLLNKYSKMEKEIKELKDDNKKMKKENDQLNQNITNLKMEINSMKNNQNNEIVRLQNQVKDISNMMNLIMQKMNEFNFLNEEMNMIEKQIKFLSMPLQSFMQNNQIPFDPNNMALNNNNSNDGQNFMGINNIQNNNLHEEFEDSIGITIIFKENGKETCFIQCLTDEKISDIIKRYRLKSDNQNPDVRFIFNAKKLNKGLTVAEAGLGNYSNIYVIQTKK